MGHKKAIEVCFLFLRGASGFRRFFITRRSPLLVESKAVLRSIQVFRAWLARSQNLSLAKEKSGES